MVDLILPGFDGEWAGEDYKVSWIYFSSAQSRFRVVKTLFIKILAIEKIEKEISIETKNGS